MKKFKLVSSLLAVVMVLSMLMVMPVSAAEVTIDGPYDFEELVAGDSYDDPNSSTATHIIDPAVTDAYVGDILRQVKIKDNDYCVTLEDFSGSNSEGFSAASGKVVSIRSNVNYYLLKNIEGDEGIEIYEFDFLWGHASISSAMVLKCQDTGTDLLPTEKIKSKGNTTWKHMRIEYDTEEDTLTLKVDGESINQLTDVTTFDEPLILTCSTGSGLMTRAKIFQMDNYVSKVEGGSTDADGNPIYPSHNFNEVTTETFNDAAGKEVTDGVTDKDVANILSYMENGKNCVVSVEVGESVNKSQYANPEGKAIATRKLANFLLLDNITGDTGIEVYEFDFLWSYATSSANMILQCQDTGEYLLSENKKVDCQNNTTWKHMKIEYNTASDTLTVYIDEENYGTLENVTTFEQPLLLTASTKNAAGNYQLPTRAKIFTMDNYNSYVITGSTPEPDVEEKMTFTDFNITKADGSAIVSPVSAGTEIKITATANSTFTDAQTVTVIYAFYSDDELVAVGTDETVSIASGNSVMSAYFTLEKDVTYSSVKAFVWKSLTDMTPLVGAVSK